MKWVCCRLLHSQAAEQKISGTYVAEILAIHWIIVEQWFSNYIPTKCTKKFHVAIGTSQIVWVRKRLAFDWWVIPIGPCGDLQFILALYIVQDFMFMAAVEEITWTWQTFWYRGSHTYAHVWGHLCLHALLSQSRNAYRWGKLLGGLLARCVKSQPLWMS